jgi:circadian clock protein KaiB
LKNKTLIKPVYQLRLYIAGASPNSNRAINNIRIFCEQHLKDCHNLEIIDVYQQPQIAVKDQVIALPLLIKSSPPPLKRLIGDMSDTAKLIKGLDLDVTVNVE